MGQGAAEPLPRRLVKSTEHVVDVAGVECRMLFCDFVGTSPTRLVEGDPGTIVGGEIGDVHGLSFA